MTVQYPLAGVPDTPLNAPVSDSAVTSTQFIKVDVDTITNDNGSPILSYSIEMDNGLGGNFIPLYGDVIDSLSTTVTVSQGVYPGRTYRL